MDINEILKKDTFSLNIDRKKFNEEFTKKLTESLRLDEEEFQIARAGDTWNVVNSRGDVVSSGHRFPGAARAERDRLRTTSTPRTPPTPENVEAEVQRRINDRQLTAEQQAKLEATKERHNDLRRQHRRFVNRGFRSLMIWSFLSYVGWEQTDQEMDEFGRLLSEYHVGLEAMVLTDPAPGQEQYGDEHFMANKRIFDKAVAAAYTTTTTMIIADVMSTMVLGAKGVAFVVNIVRWARRLRLTATAVAAAGGAAAGFGIGGVVTGALTFVLTGVALWLVERLLRSEGVRSYIAQAIIHYAVSTDQDTIIDSIATAYDNAALFAANAISDIDIGFVNDLEADLNDFRNTVTGYGEISGRDQAAIDNLFPSQTTTGGGTGTGQAGGTGTGTGQAGGNNQAGGNGAGETPQGSFSSQRLDRILQGL